MLLLFDRSRRQSSNKDCARPEESEFSISEQLRKKDESKSHGRTSWNLLGNLTRVDSSRACESFSHNASVVILAPNLRASVAHSNQMLTRGEVRGTKYIMHKAAG